MIPPTLLDWCPTRRPEIVLGPGLLRGSARVHVIRDDRNLNRYEIGSREYFVLSRLDGATSLAEIGEAYTRTFHRRLGEANWAQLLDLMVSKDLLVSAVRRPPVPAQPEPILPRSRWYRGYKSIGRPAGLIATLLRFQRVLFSPLLWVPLVAAMVAMVVYLFSHFTEVATQAKGLLNQPELALLVYCLLLASGGLHEVGHGLVATRFGGGTRNVGVRWQIPILAMYCEVEDVNLFRSRWQRIATASVGVAINLIFLMPFFAMWRWLPLDHATRGAVAAMLLLGTFRALFNLLPISPTDGYLVLSHALNMVKLAEESLRYLRRWTLALVRKAERPRGYPGLTPVVYVGYGLLHITSRVGMAIGMSVAAIRILPYHLGVVLVSVVVMQVVLRRVGLYARARMARRAAEPRADELEPQLEAIGSQR